MFKRSKRKIVAVVTISLFVLMATILGAIFLSSRSKLHRQYMDMLDTYIANYISRDVPPPDEKKKPPRDEREYQMSSFYSAVFDDNGKLVSISPSKAYSAPEVESMARGFIGSGRTSGQTDAIAYKIKSYGNLTIVAFMDTTLTDSGLNTMLMMTVIVGFAAIVVIFVTALFIAQGIVKPLEENDAKQKSFVSDAGHELKTPVSAIGTNVELLIRSSGENEWLSNIRFETERMGNLVSQLLELSRAESGKSEGEDIDFGRLVFGEILHFESIAFERGLIINSDLAEGCIVHANSVQLKKLVSVLLDNAVKYAKNSDTIDIKLTREHKKAVFTVINGADPIPPEKLSHIFDRFYRIDEARGTEDNHYGLGLSIAKAVVAEYHGSISAECKDGKIIFTTVMPLRR